LVAITAQGPVDLRMAILISPGEFMFAGEDMFAGEITKADT
jgi:hypothetical protein